MRRVVDTRARGHGVRQEWLRGRIFRGEDILLDSEAKVNSCLTPLGR